MFESNFIVFLLMKTVGCLLIFSLQKAKYYFKGFKWLINIRLDYFRNYFLKILQSVQMSAQRMSKYQQSQFF